MRTLPTILIAAALTFQQVIGDNFVSTNVLPRQLGGMTIPSNIDTKCVATCSGFSNGILECTTTTTTTTTCMCSPSLATPFRDCLQCLVGHGMTTAEANKSLGEFTEGCEALGYSMAIAPIGSGAATNSVSTPRLSPTLTSRTTASTPYLPSPSSTTKSNTDFGDSNQSGSSDSPFGTNNNGAKNGSESNGAFSLQTSNALAILGLVVTLIHYL